MGILDRIGVGWEKVQALYCSFLGRTYHCGCGHSATWKTILTISGDQGVFNLPSTTPDYCPQCWAKAAIKCAWCGEAILPGSPITLNTPTKPDFKIPDYAVVYKRKSFLQLVGCLRLNCADSGADRAGFWVMPGKVQRVQTLLEMLTLNGGRECVMINDLTDIWEATLIPEESPDT